MTPMPTFLPPQTAPGWVPDAAEPGGELRSARRGADSARHHQHGALLRFLHRSLGHQAEETDLRGNLGGESMSL